MATIEEIRHSLAHLLGAAVLELWPDTKLAIGPAIDNGFYYDFDFAEPISQDDLPKIEVKMKEKLKSWELFQQIDVTAEEAKDIFSANIYKLELINDIIEKKEKVTLYYSGPRDSIPTKADLIKAKTYKLQPTTAFLDLCRGGHSNNPSQEISVDSWKLDRLAGAYWRGDETKPMLTRIYGLAFATKEELGAYVTQQEEAKKRDHRILGKTLKLFTISPLVGSGLPLLQPNGMIIRQEIENYLWELHRDKGYDRVWTPHIAHETLYETSGHAAKFGDELFRVNGKEEKFILKPMNCPHHMQIFADNQWSYREMPVRYFEPATVYRDEKSGQLSGLTRVRSITQDDGHLFCRVSQIKDEVKTITDIIKTFYSTIGLLDNYWVSLSVRGDDQSKYLGTDEVWQTAEAALEEAAKQNDLPYKRTPGEAAFYGPKLDFMFKDAIGRQWQLATIQCDFNLPERFDLSFINEQGEKERPVVIHRAISGSLERFMGIIIEHFAGAFPTWLSPVQIKILPISDKQADYAEQIFQELTKNHIRTELDDSSESLGKKIRGAKMQKIPYLIVIGEKEVSEEMITVENRAGGSEKMSLVDFVGKIKGEISTRQL